MNKEEFISIVDQIRQPLLVEEPKALRRYNEADFELTELQRLDRVRRELAALPIVIVPVNPAKVVRQEPKTVGEAFLDLLFGFVGLVLIKTGEFMESFDEKK